MFRCLCVLSFSCFLAMRSPLSPSLSSYRFPLAAILSISHRLSGAFLFFYTGFFSWYVFAHFYMPSSFLHTVLSPFFSGYLGSFLFCFFLFFFCYHLCSGVRHLFWDFCIGLSQASVKVSNFVVIISALLLFFLVFSLVFL
ncbi:succinate dehydrogenase, cytochrome b556 subunit [Neorickettsia findlayensis]|uniref:Succinate dehydrogenase cytochrome b556 subunit n=2 Tax=Neorickettsia findlayensis TaxID=2686014 RepID=A0A6P1GAE8_9RICK|nr:succinate dehydrogenase, cytochrome b556 subunit [Neorickettsia findlayensis]